MAAAAPVPPAGYVALQTSLAPAELAVASELLLVQFPTGFDLASLAGVRLKLLAQPAGADGVVCTAALPDGSTFQLVQESASLAAQLRVVATPGSGGAALRDAQAQPPPRLRRALTSCFSRACTLASSGAQVTRRLTAIVKPAAAAAAAAAPAAATPEGQAPPEPSPLPSTQKKSKKEKRERAEEAAPAAAEEEPVKPAKEKRAKR